MDRPFPLASLFPKAARAATLEGASIGERAIYAGGRCQRAQVFDRLKLPLGAALEGPAIVQQIDATSVIEPGAAARVDAIGNLLIRVGAAA